MNRILNSQIPHKFQRSKQRRAHVEWVALLFFLLQAIIPAGYMPASFADDGVFIKFCPSGVSSEVMAILHAGHDLEHDVQERVDSSNDNESAHQHHAMYSSEHHRHHEHHEHHGHHGYHAMHHAPAMAVDEPQTVHATGNHDNHDHSMQGGWQADCEFGAAKTSADFSLVVSSNNDLALGAGYSQLQQLSAEIIARLHRKQQQRAPPFFS